MTQFATFRLDKRLFGLDILGIREINRILDITPVQTSPNHIRGLINLRGQIVTLVDLAVRLGMPRREITEDTHNIILKTDTEIQALKARGGSPHLAGSPDLVGLLVDAIGDVIEGDEAQIEPPPANLNLADERFLLGVIRTEAGLLVLLNLNDVLNTETHS